MDLSETRCQILKGMVSWLYILVQSCARKNTILTIYMLITLHLEESFRDGFRAY